METGTIAALPCRFGGCDHALPMDSVLVSGKLSPCDPELVSRQVHIPIFWHQDSDRARPAGQRCLKLLMNSPQ